MQSSPVLAAAFVAFFSLSPALALPPDVDTRNTIKRDVAIIGGGSSGINAAILLKDAGKSVVVIEAKAIPGGHTHTYTDPATGLTTDNGVIIWHNNTLVNQYFQRFNIPLAPGATTAGANIFVDFKSGAIVNGTAQQGNQQALDQALQKYAAFLSKYPQLATGMFLPKPVPQELAMPFGQLVQQLGIEAAMPLFTRLNTGLGDPLTIPVVEFSRVLGLPLIQQLGGAGFVTTARKNNSELYLKAGAELAQSNSILLSSRVIASDRKQSGAQLVVQTPEGIKYVCAKKLLISIPPRLENLKELNPTQAERHVFSKWLNAGYYSVILKNSGLPDLEVDNINPNSPLGIPDLPAAIFAGPSGIPGHTTLFYQIQRSPAAYAYTDDQIRVFILADLKRLQTVNRAHANFTQTRPEFVVTSAHVPFYLQVSAHDILDGFYNQMNALQGQFNTFYTGAAWRGQDSSILWEYNKSVLLPLLLKSLEEA